MPRDSHEVSIVDGARPLAPRKATNSVTFSWETEKREREKATTKDW